MGSGGVSGREGACLVLPPWQRAGGRVVPILFGLWPSPSPTVGTGHDPTGEAEVDVPQLGSPTTPVRLINGGRVLGYVCREQHMNFNAG